ncbi:MAG: sugar phosphate isomerase/epimerase [Spirochaetaceae bacterium]|nr:sugar phosphate isomerase/epimerase [Spirochaetaceae bacterium]
MGTMRLGLQMYTMRPHTRTREETEATLKEVAAMGYRAVQVQPDCCPLALEEIGELARSCGLSICATHVSTDWIFQDTSAVIKAHKAIGCDCVGIGAMDERYADSGAGFVEFARRYNQAGRMIADHGQRLIYHNHQFEFRRYDGRLGMEILIDEFDPSISFELDTYWAQTGGADPTVWIRKLAGRLPVVHFKDMSLEEGNRQVFAPVGEGNMNWSGIIAACREAGVSWCVVEQDTCARSAFDCVRSSREYLNGLGLE